MTAPDLPTWTVAEDGWGDPTIWTDGDHAVATRWGDRIRIDPAFTEQVWQVLTAVLAPDEATVERLARGARPTLFGGRLDSEVGPGTRYERGRTRDLVRGFLRALAGTSEQARHTADDATGGGA